jgi:hypothetical protein
MAPDGADLTLLAIREADQFEQVGGDAHRARIQMARKGLDLQDIPFSKRGRR